jgi:hypothetical protein
MIILEGYKESYNEIRKGKFSNKLNEAYADPKLNFKPFSKFYDLYYSDVDSELFVTKLSQYFKELEYLNVDDNKMSTDDMGIKANSLGKVAYFKMIKTSSSDPDYRSLEKEYKSRNDASSWMSLSDLRRNWKDGYNQAKSASPYLFE